VSPRVPVLVRGMRVLARPEPVRIPALA
jgi:hypothetical protein